MFNPSGAKEDRIGVRCAESGRFQGGRKILNFDKPTVPPMAAPVGGRARPAKSSSLTARPIAGDYVIYDVPAMDASQSGNSHSSLANHFRHSHAVTTGTLHDQPP